MRFVIALTAAALLLAGCGGGGGKRAQSTTGSTKKNLGVGPIGFTAKNLKAESKFLHTTFYWAGPKQGYLYEFTRAKKTGYMYVRYLPPGVRPGAKGTKYLIIVTYPAAGAYQILKTQAGKKAVAGPGGSILYVRPNNPTSVLMAFPNVNDEVEVYAPKAADALAMAKSGNVVPVG